ncbi:MAG: nitroreductase family protein, partial [Clostridia bacterium]|nr:nitroreductase family protein [Clostridia bacterium]
MEFNRLIETRRSTRGFDGTPLPQDLAKELLYAATKAPNACNLQSWHFYALDQASIRKLVPDVYRGEWILQAGAAFVICTEDGK